MTSETNGGSTDAAVTEADFAKAFRELAQGEEAAASIEAKLSALERNIEALLAQASEDEKSLSSSNPNTSHEGDKQDGKIPKAE